jgi:branched-chain amino acid transport system ATP-binding protein
MVDTPILDVTDLHVSYGPIKAVRGLSLTVGLRETVAVIGANGAGKTTLMRAISNLLAPAAGQIRLRGAPTAGIAPHTLARRGLLHIPEGRGTLQRLSVLENLRIAFDREAVGAGRTGRDFVAALDDVYARFPRLAERSGQAAGTLSGGEQQMLALARAIIQRPILLLLDEPSLGLSPRMVREAFQVLAEFKADGIPMVVVEQNARAALSLADTGYVMRQGEIVASAAARDLLQDSSMLRHYLGS